MSIVLRSRLLCGNEWSDLLFTLSESFTKNLFQSRFEHWSNGKPGTKSAITTNVVRFEPDALQGQSMALTKWLACVTHMNGQLYKQLQLQAFLLFDRPEPKDLTHSVGGSSSKSMIQDDFSKLVLNRLRAACRRRHAKAELSKC